MPLLSPKFFIEAALSRVTSLNKFARARQIYRDAGEFVLLRRLTPAQIKEAVKDAGLNGLEDIHDVAAGQEHLGQNIHMISVSLDNMGNDRSGKTGVTTLSHETVHIAQDLNGDPEDSIEIPYVQRPREIEAYALEENIANFAIDISKVTADIETIDSRVGRASTLLTGLKRLREQALGIDLAATPNNPFNEDVRAEIGRLTRQIRTLEARIENLSQESALNDERTGNEIEQELNS